MPAWTDSFGQAGRKVLGLLISQAGITSHTQPSINFYSYNYWNTKNDLHLYKKMKWILLSFHKRSL